MSQTTLVSTSSDARAVAVARLLAGAGAAETHDYPGLAGDLGRLASILLALPEPGAIAVSAAILGTPSPERDR